MCHLSLYDPAFVDKGTALFNLSGGSRADNIVQPDVPVLSVVRVTGVDNLALDTTKDINNIPALDRSGLGALLWDSHHSFFPQDDVPHFYGLQVIADLQVLVVLASGNEVSFSGVAPGHVLTLLRYAEWSSVLGGPFRFGICRFWYSVKIASSRLY